MPADGKHKYIALSYVWGATRSLMTVSSNLVRFQCRDAFLEDEFLSKISETIKNAMYVVGLLGERYLWVDSL